MGALLPFPPLLLLPLLLASCLCSRSFSLRTRSKSVECATLAFVRRFTIWTCSFTSLNNFCLVSPVIPVMPVMPVSSDVDRAQAWMGSGRGYASRWWWAYPKLTLLLWLLVCWRAVADTCSDASSSSEDELTGTVDAMDGMREEKRWSPEEAVGAGGSRHM